MRFDECARLLEAEVLVPPTDPEMEIRVACGSDLMSDVMAFACSANEMLLTGLVNPQVIRTAEMMDVKAVVFVRGKRPDDGILELARTRRVAVMRTACPMFVACGRLYAAGVRGKGE